MSKSILNPAFCATKDDGGDKVPAWTSLARRAATVSGTPPTPRIMTSLSNQPGFAQCHPSGEIGAATKPGNADDLPRRSCSEVISGALCMVNRNLSLKLAINTASNPASTAEGTVRLETPWAKLTEPPINAWILRAPVTM